MIELRLTTDWGDCLQCEELQRTIWETPNGTDVVPASLLITAAKYGGVLVGAFEGPRMIGFVFGFMGAEGTGDTVVLKHCSHMLGVLPEYRRHGLGLELKKKQREYLLSKRIELATWTYDPLQAANAHLNMNGLGAFARRYIREAYGNMIDVLNAGIASDRFEVEWWVESERVRRIIEGGPSSPHESQDQIQQIYKIAFDDREFPHVTGVEEFAAEECSIEIPADLNRLKAGDLALAGAWRYWTRASFETAFAMGYQARQVSRWEDDRKRPRIAYILSKADRAR